MRLHLERYIDELIREGVSPDDAARRARLELGDPAAEAERLADARPGAWVEGVMRDARHTLRSLRRAPAFTIAVAALIAVGIGATTTIFTLVDRVLLRPLDLPDAPRIVRLYESSEARGVARTGVSRGALAEWRRRSTTFAGMAVTYLVGRTISDIDDPRADVVGAAQVSCDFFSIVGTPFIAGAPFTADQCADGKFSGAAAPVGTDPVVVLGEAIWRTRFGSDPGILGKSIRVDRRPFRVIGVVPANAATAVPGAEVFLPWTQEGELAFDQRYPSAIGRLAASASITDARAELRAIAATVAVERPPTNAEWTAVVEPLQAALVAGLKPVLSVLLASAAVLLLIACANVATLFSARAIARAHEASLHLALGAPRGRLLRRVLMESGMVVAAGGAVGALGAIAVTRFMRSAWSDLPRAAELEVDGAVLAFASVTTLAAAMLAGLAPALQQARRDPIHALRGGRRLTSGHGTGRWRDALVAAEVALTMVLLAGAGLVLQSVAQLRAHERGFDSSDVVVAPVFLDGQAYGSGAASRAYYERLFARLRALPGVVSVGGATTLPTSALGPNFSRPVWPIERAGDARAARDAAVRIVTPGYFATLGMRVVDGRAFDDSDGPDARRVIAVSERLAKALWPGERAIGRQLVVDYASAGTYPYEIVGVVNDVRFAGPRSDPLEEVYFPHAQRSYLILNVAIRARPGALPTPAVVQSVMREIDPSMPPHGVRRLEELVSATFARDRRAMIVLIAFAVAAALISALGIYGSLAYRVRQQSREIGVRLALGATPRHVVGWVARDVARVFAIGASIGLAASILAAQSLRALLFGVAPGDPLTLAAAVLVLALTAVLAAGVPAIRAARTDPNTAIRG